jgi:hypothetical protein
MILLKFDVGDEGLIGMYTVLLSWERARMRRWMWMRNAEEGL